MSARKLTTSDVFRPLTVKAQKTLLSLPSHAFRIRKNGIEFKSAQPITPWTEMTVELEVPAEHTKVHCNGVVVACAGNRHVGYNVSMVFTHISRQAQARLNTLAVPPS